MEYVITVKIVCDQPNKHEFVRGILHEKATVFASELQEFVGENHGEVYETRREVQSVGVVECEKSG